ncbi:MAG: hypothetical protein ACTSPW_00055 [Promethearchaeota archaeon]
MSDDFVRKYKINKYITLKLEKEGQTVIYINNKPFLECMNVVLNIPKNKIKNFDEISSIDNAIEIYEKNFDNDYEVEISPEEEFIVHCSNIQAWVENDYNTNILHSNISFPLLKELSELGDPKAKKVFKNEIAKRVINGELSVVLFLLEENYIKYLNVEERQIFFLENNENLLKKIQESLENSLDLKLTKPILLLDKLIDLGDPLALEIFKDFIIKIFRLRDFSKIYELLTSNVINYFDEDEREILFLKNNPFLIKIIKEYLSENNLKYWKLTMHLLEELEDLGDEVAKKMLKLEVKKRFLEGNLILIEKILKENYIEYLNNDDLRNLFLNKNKLLYYNIKDKISTIHIVRLKFYFNFLDKLAKLGDDYAKELLKQEIEKRIKNKEMEAIYFFLTSDFVQYFNKESKQAIFLKNNDKFLEYINELREFPIVMAMSTLIQALYELANMGDSLAVKIFKEEFKKRLTYGSLFLIYLILNPEYLHKFTDEEIKDIFLENNNQFLMNILGQYKKESLRFSILLIKILQELEKIGDPLAGKILKQKILECMLGKNYSIILELLENNLIKYLNHIERQKILLENNKTLFKSIKDNLLNNNFNPSDKTIRILIELIKIKDKLAEKILIQEIKKHFENVNFTVILRILKHNFLSYININEQRKLLSILYNKIKENIERDDFSHYIISILKRCEPYNKNKSKNLISKALIKAFNTGNIKAISCIYHEIQLLYSLNSAERERYYLKNNQNLVKKLDLILNDDKIKLNENMIIGIHNFRDNLKEAAFNILKFLAILGDFEAKLRLENEIFKICRLGDISQILYLLKLGFFNFIKTDGYKEIFLCKNHKLYSNFRKFLKNPYMQEGFYLLHKLIQYGDPLAIIIYNKYKNHLEW